MASWILVFFFLETWDNCTAQSGMQIIFSFKKIKIYLFLYKINKYCSCTLIVRRSLSEKKLMVRFVVYFDHICHKDILKIFIIINKINVAYVAFDCGVWCWLLLDNFICCVSVIAQIEMVENYVCFKM